jgi:hypothetical protein
MLAFESWVTACLFDVLSIIKLALLPLGPSGLTKRPSIKATSCFEQRNNPWYLGARNKIELYK